MVLMIDHDIYGKDGKLILAKGEQIELSKENEMRLRRFGVFDEDPLARPAANAVPAVVNSAMRQRASRVGGKTIALNPLITNSIDHKSFNENRDLTKAYGVVENLLHGSKTTTWHPYVVTLMNYVDWLYSHSINTALISCLIGSKLLYSDARLNQLALGAMMHDIGMTLLPKAVLNKPTRLTDAEMIVVRNHCEMGYSMLMQTDFPETSKNIILQHHEKNNGTGYPNGLKADRITEEAKIVAIAEDFDTATTARPYKAAKPVGDVLAEMMTDSSTYEFRMVKILIENMQ